MNSCSATQSNVHRNWNSGILELVFTNIPDNRFLCFLATLFILQSMPIIYLLRLNSKLIEGEVSCKI